MESMDFSTVGFIRADKHRLSILEAVKAKATEKQISGRLRLPTHLVGKGLKELEEKELIAADKDGFTTTEKGLKILAQISKQSL